MISSQDTIVAIATAAGIGAIGIVRLSGAEAITIVDQMFLGKQLARQQSHTLHFGKIVAPEDGSIIDEVVVSLFKAPRSYTGEDVVEISGHGSPYILQCILQACIIRGARMALPGEFTQRAFLNGKLDLTQAEAVADLIAANSKAAQQTAINQLRGGFSNDLKYLREQLINFAALIELELDFSDEDVAFADRSELSDLIRHLKNKVQSLIDSFRLGNVVKNGVSVAIVGRPNAGKSTLLNTLLNEERAIVSHIAGTTRDTIEETLNIKGILFRIIDTAGIRKETSDIIEQIGVGKSLEKMRQADVVIYLFDARESDPIQIKLQEEELQQENLNYILVANKTDTLGLEKAKEKYLDLQDIIYISAKEKTDIELLKERLYNSVIEGEIQTEDTIVTNARHHNTLLKIAESIQDIEYGMSNNLSGDLLALDIRRCLHFLGSITGQIEVDRDILGTIFGRFCIGK